VSVKRSVINYIRLQRLLYFCAVISLYYLDLAIFVVCGKKYDSPPSSTG